MLIDTSVLIALFKDRTGLVAHGLRDILDDRGYYLTRFTQMELLQGARDEKEWLRLSDYLADQDYLEMDDESWANAARLYFDLRRRGLTVRSVIDCCIAEVALCHEMTLIHNDRDFATIAKLRALKHVQFNPVAVAGLHEPAQTPLRYGPGAK
jgi:predicted nucleic acid-binding protein